MSESVYYGAYARYETPSKKDAAQLISADNLVGDVFDIEFITKNGQRTAWMKNRFGSLVAFFDEDTSRTLSLCEAKGWTTKAILSFVAYSEQPEPGLYWGESALICYDPRETAFEHYISVLGKRIADGNRPEVDLGEQGVRQVIESNGEWTPTKLLSLPKMKPGSALLKTRRSISERLVEQGRKGNKGCYLISWAFLLLLVAVLIFGLRSCGVF